MADTHETITDIIREARDKYTVHNCNECNYRKSCDWNDWNFGSVECEAKRQSISLLLGIDDDYFNKLLTRLEAAHDHDIATATEASARAVVGACVKQQEAERKCVALREALEFIAHYNDNEAQMDDPYCADGHILAGKAKEALGIKEKEGGAK